MTDIFASLVYDSWEEPIPDLRSRPEDRHLIYEGGGVVLDLMLKQAEGGACLHVGGQVLPTEGPIHEVADLAVSMQHGERKSYTYTNALGEFMFHAITKGSIDLSITLKNRRFKVLGLSSKEPKMWRVVPTMASGD